MEQSYTWTFIRNIVWIQMFSLNNTILSLALETAVLPWIQFTCFPSILYFIPEWNLEFNVYLFLPFGMHENSPFD